MAKLVNIAKMATATVGTGTLTLGAAEDGYLSFADAGVADGDVVTYTLREGLEAEVGRGTYTAAGTTLSRDTVLASTNAGAKITLSGVAKVAVTIAAEDVIEPPASSTDNALVRFDTASGRKVQNSGAILDDLNNLNGLLSVEATSTVAATHPATFKNTNDAASVAALRLEGDRATPAADDRVYASFYLSDSTGVQTEFARIEGRATAVANGSESANIRFHVANGAAAGVLTEVLSLGQAALWPSTNDLLTLGTAAFGFADLFFASGAAINWNNGDVTFTHIADGLIISGANSVEINQTGTYPTLQFLRADTHGDGVYTGLLRFYGKDSAGNTEEYARVSALVATATNTSESSQLRFGVNSGGTLTEALALLPGYFLPLTNDGVVLGTGANSFSDLYLASGGVISWNNGDVTFTHSANLLTMAGGLLAVSPSGNATQASPSTYGFQINYGADTAITIGYDGTDDVIQTWNGKALNFNPQGNAVEVAGNTIHHDGNAGRCRAWVSFNGSGTVAIGDDYNVSSITDNAAGDYTVNFTSALANANYAVQITAEGGSPSNPSYYVWTTGSRTTTSVRLRTKAADALADFSNVFVTIHGN